MVSNQMKALKALHKLLIFGRGLAFEETSSNDLAWFFDDIELLPALMMQDENKDEVFASHLKQIGLKFNCSHIYSQYSSGLV